MGGVGVALTVEGVDGETDEPAWPDCATLEAFGEIERLVRAAVAPASISSSAFPASGQEGVDGAQCRERGIPDWSEAEGGYAAKARRGAPGTSYDRPAERHEVPGCWAAQRASRPRCVIHTPATSRLTMWIEND